MKTILWKAAMAAVLTLCGALQSSIAADTAKTETKQPSWNVTGELEEACSCHAPCPCWFKSVPSRMTCDGAQMVFITKGSYGKTSLDGLAVAQFVQSPEGKSMFESFGNWNFDNVYIDERATEAQRTALKEISAHLFPLAAKKREFKFVPITRQIQGAEHLVTVGTFGSFSGHLIEGGLGGPPKVSNPPLADPTHKEYLQGQATVMTYNDSGQKWKYENSNYMRNKFKVDDRQYAKFEADMAKKMAAMNAPKK
ncbi:DUF1326 domain-containing protein [Prosthecobacter sp.]|uniref:DUF1326 domain-containing protein n=1 Tax=Prosthecobacter sp. TaxID=1965333 RepID=UPI002ABC8432|nr:DUF1326 domain-containing protein [Prosthecobacter sp.]MDZ4404825.1 DUF1326 domain-containing protein [Prosthecobacter sp.]